MREQKQPRLAAFQYRDFRLLWGGRLFSNIGSQMQFIAINWHIFALLHGIATVLITGWIAWRYPGLRRYEGETAVSSTT